MDLNTQVYGTDNLFVVDASIFPGHVTANPSAYIVVVSERAAERILALAPAKPQNQYQQCNGQNYVGSFQCASPFTCQYVNDFYSQASTLLTFLRRAAPLCLGDFVANRVLLLFLVSVRAAG